MFISENAYFRQGKAIKGGIPICWPWFGAAPIKPDNPDHGFVRNNYWTVLAVDTLKNGDTKVKLEFVDSDKTREMWPYHFCLSLGVTIGDSLTLDLVAQNTGEQAFSITEALHAYFNVGDAAQVQVLGLEKTEYLDKTEGFVKVCQIGAVTLEQATDHIHIDVGHDLTIKDPVLKRNIRITSSGNKNVVVWNPWAKGAEQMQDLEGEDYKRFVCVEIANAASNKVTILPGSGYRMVTNYKITRD
jgi:glucose-6-phosphate 1-epimerase